MNQGDRARHDRMLAAYGFGLFDLPTYREVTAGEWRLVRHLPSLAEGYVAGPGVERIRHVLYHRRTPWMSTGMLEQESHAFHVHLAHGVVVVAGLGLAMYLHAVAHKPSVARVVVIEIADDVIRLMRDACRWDTWPGREKIIILQADARDKHVARHVLAASSGRSPDYLFADIWARCADPRAPAECAGMVRSLKPKAAGWWGQELSFAEWWRDHRRPGEGQAAGPMGGAQEKAGFEPALGDYFAAIGVPVPATPGYAAFCRDAAAANGFDRPRPAPSFALRRVWRRIFPSGRGS